MASVLRMSRRVTEFSLIVRLPVFCCLGLARLQVAFLGFVEQVFGRAPRQRHNRKSGVLIGVGDQRRAVHDENVFHIVSLAVAVQDGGLGVGAHACCAHLVDDFSALGNPERMLAADGSLGFVFAAGCFDDGAKSFLHVLGLAQFVFAPLAM